ncbi:MAG: tetratricopeptide repeat protein [Roseiarcus sp.]
MNRKQRRGALKNAAESVPSDSIARLFAQAVGSHRAGALGEAQAAYRGVLTLRPDHAAALRNLGLVLHTQGQLVEAVEYYRQAIVRHPGYFEAVCDLGAALKDLGRLDEAETASRRAVSIDPASSLALSNLGSVLCEQGQLEEAACVLRKALAKLPEDRWSLSNLVTVLERQGQVEEATALGRRVVALHPDFLLGQFNLATVLSKYGSIDESIAVFNRALALDPGMAEAHFGLGQALLLRGEFARGWEEYEWRWRLKEYAWVRSIRGVVEKPRWRGEDLADKTIMLCAEQGFGDTFQFIRYTSLVVAKARRVILLVQPALKQLLGGVAGVTLLGLDEPAPDFDVYCPLLSLPRIFAAQQGTALGQAPYLAADSAAVDRWRARLGDGGVRIGVAWQGKPGINIDQGRSIPLACLAPLSRVPGVRLINLQKNAGIEQLAGLPDGMRVETLGPDFDGGPGAFLDTAAAMMSLDLIVTSDTAIAHLAGALGRKTWVALKAVPDWRWQLGTSRSPWYPTMRLFRQSVAGDWAGVFAEMAEALTQSPISANAPADSDAVAPV